MTRRRGHEAGGVARARVRAHGESGLTIIETLFSIVILALGFLGMAGVHAMSSKAQTLGKSQGLATYVANQQLELMRRSSFANVVAATSTATLDGVQFTINRTVTTIGSNKRVDVTSTWNDRFGTQTVRLVTMVSQVTNP